MSNDEYALLKATPDQPLADALATYLTMDLWPVTFTRFKGIGDPIPGSNLTFGGETKCVIDKNISGKHAFVVFSPRNTNDELVQALIMCDALSLSCDIASTTLVAPCFPYGREDQTYERRGPLTAALIPRLLKAAGCDRILTVDLHSDASEAGFRNAGIRTRMLRTRPLVAHDLVRTLYPELTERYGLKGDFSDLDLGAPDIGGLKQIEKVLKDIRRNGVGNQEIDFLFHHKQRNTDPQRPNSVNGKGIYNISGGSIGGKVVVFADDILGSGDTIFSAARSAKKEGAQCVVGYCTHAFGFDGLDSQGENEPFFDKLLDSSLDVLTVSDTIPSFETRLEARLASENNPETRRRLAEKVRILSVVPLLGEAITRMHTGETIRDVISEVDVQNLYTLRLKEKH